MRANEVALWLIIATAVVTSHNVNILKVEIRATTISTEDVVVISVLCCRTDDVLHGYISDNHAIGRYPSWATVKVVLLDIKAVSRSIHDADIPVGDAGRAVSIYI